MTEPRQIVAYLQKGVWYKVDEVQTKRHADRGAFMDAMPYTIAALRNRREYGRDVPSWIDLDTSSESTANQQQ